MRGKNTNESFDRQLSLPLLVCLCAASAYGAKMKTI